jgi:hypothetical protein
MGSCLQRSLPALCLQRPWRPGMEQAALLPALGGLGLSWRRRGPTSNQHGGCRALASRQSQKTITLLTPARKATSPRSPSFGRRLGLLPCVLSPSARPGFQVVLAESAFHIPDTGRGPVGETAPSQNSHPPFPRHLPGTNSTPQTNKGRRFPDARNRRRWQVSPLSPTKATPKIP